MTALAADRNTKRVQQRYRGMPNIAAAVVIYEGAMVAQDSSGNCRPARANSADKVLGFAMKRCNNAVGSGGSLNGVAGAFPGGVPVNSDDIAKFANSATTDAITSAHIGLSCYVVDDQTVALTDNGGARPRAGKIHQVDSDGVWVDFNTRPAFVAVTAYLADLGTASSTYATAPVAGRVAKVSIVAHGAVNADAACTSAIQPKAGGGFTAITGGGMTVTTAAAAAGDEKEATPTAANTVSAGDTLRFTTDGVPSNVVAATVTFLIEVAAA